MLDINIKSNMKDVLRSIDAFTARQLPFALAQGINTTAARVQVGEEANIKATFKSPTPFTQKSVGLSKARKTAPSATIFIKKIAAAYLQPYEGGGVHKLSSRALLNPKNVKLNSYGQLPRGTLAKLKAQPGVFVGVVKTKGGQSINGVWQRPFLRGRDAQLGAGMSVRKRNKLLRGKHPDMPKGANTSGKLRLLIRFGDALPVEKELKFGATAREIVDRYFPGDFQAALAQAMRTAK